jgi:voltage-gated potassium channel
MTQLGARMREGSLNESRRGAPYLLFMLALSVYAVLALAFSTFGRPSADTRQILDYADTAVCALFLLDFFVTLVRSRNRLRYLLTWGWLDLLSSIPTVDALRWGRTARVLRILRVLRGIRAAKIVTEFLLYRRAQSTFLAALLISLLLVVLAASSILQLETGPEANIRTPEDAVWWAVVTITTVGYGDKFPVTTEGRMIAALLMTAGVGMFGTFSGFVASWFLSAPQQESEEPLLLAVQELQREVQLLREQVRDRREVG